MFVVIGKIIMYIPNYYLHTFEFDTLSNIWYWKIVSLFSRQHLHFDLDKILEISEKQLMGFAKMPAALKVYLLKVAKIRTKVSVSTWKLRRTSKLKQGKQESFCVNFI